MFSLCVAALATSSNAAISPALKTLIVNKHNELRGAVSQPCTAADMETLVWDDTIAAASQAYADNCVGDHDPQLKSMGGTIPHGENLYMHFPQTTYTDNDIITGGV